MPLKHLLLLASLWLLVAPAMGQPVALTSTFEQHHLGEELSYIEDSQGSLTLADLLVTGQPSAWQRSTQPTLSFGFTTSTYWVRLPLSNPTNETIPLLLEVGYPLLDHVEAYVLQQGQLISEFVMGSELPFWQRPILHPNMTVPFTIPPQQDIQILLRVSSGSAMQIPLTLWRPDHFTGHTYRASMGEGLIYGFLLSIVAYNLLIFLMVRERSFLYLVLYVLSMVVVLASFRGATFALVWPDAVAWNRISVPAGIGISIFFSCLFAIHILQLPQVRPWATRVLYVVAWAGGLTVPATLVLPYQPVIVYGLILTLVSLLVNTTVYLLRCRDGFQPAYFIAFAMLVLLVTSSFTFMSKTGIIPSTLASENAAITGTCLQFLLFSFALASRMNLDRQLREQAQREQNEAQQTMTENLEQQVEERTLALQASNEQLQQLSITDGLTNLYNRRYFDDVAERENRRSFRDQTPLSLLLLDIDHFKPLNDNFGHQFGDLCLTRIGALIKDSIRRPPDVAARYGGEEFVILLPNTSAEGACHVAETVSRAIAAARITDGQHSCTLTVSIGVASRTAGDNDQVNRLLKAADQCLYQAKDQGRNCVVCQDFNQAITGEPG